MILFPFVTNLFLILSSIIININNVIGSIECNYFSSIDPLDICLSYSSYDAYYYCNGNDSVIYNEYTSGQCSLTGSTPTYTRAYNADIYGAVCNKGINCGYFTQICDGELQVSRVTDVCFPITSSYSYMYTCQGTTVTEKWFDDQDCNKNQGASPTDYADYEYNYDNCVYHCDRITDEPTTQPTDIPTIEPTQSPTCPELDCPICQTNSGDNNNNAKQNSNLNNSSNNDDGLSETVTNLIVICVVGSVVLIVYGILYFLRQQKKDNIAKEIQLKRLELMGMDMDYDINDNNNHNIYFNSNYNNNDIITNNNNNNNNNGLEMAQISGGASPVYNDIGNDDILPNQQPNVLKVKTTSGDGNINAMPTSNNGGEDNIEYVNHGATPGNQNENGDENLIQNTNSILM